MTCSAIAYTPEKLQAYGANHLEMDADHQLPGGYALAGQVQETVSFASDQGTTISFVLEMQGFYVFQLSTGQLAHIASLIAGKPQANALALLSQQPGIAKVNLQVSGTSEAALPSTTRDIHITVLSVQHPA